MTQIAPVGWYRGIDANGKPLAGGKLYTYEAGTSTPKATFTDKAGTIANANPVILDADGYADVRLDTGGYKFRLENAAGVFQREADNIDGGGSTGFASQVVSLSSSFALSVNDQNFVIVCTAALTVSLLPTAAAGDGFTVVIVNTSNGNVTLDPDGSETINGAATYVLGSGNSATLTTNGVTWFTFGTNATFADDSFRIADNADSTKRLAFDVGGISTGQTRTLTLTDTSLTIPASAAAASSLILAEDTDNGANTVQIIAPTAITSNRVLTLPDETGTVVTTARTATDTQTGIVELATNAEAQTGTDTTRAVTPAAMQAGKIVYGTAVSASGTAVDFTGIPSWANRVTIMLQSISLSGTANLLFQLGTSGGIEASGYLGAGVVIGTGGVNHSTGFNIPIGSAADSIHGAVVLNKITGNTWVVSGTPALSNTSLSCILGGSKSLGGVLDRVRITNTASNTFDAGTINVSWE